MKKVITVVLMLTAASPAAAVSPGPEQTDGYRNGNQLLEDCEAPISSQQLMLCLGYIAGIADYMAALTGAMRMIGTGKETDCVPRGVKFRQLHDVVLRQLKETPREPAHGGGNHHHGRDCRGLLRVHAEPSITERAGDRRGRVVEVRPVTADNRIFPTAPQSGGKAAAPGW